LDYRNRYALYKTDPALQSVHAIAPWVVTWDDHEVDNDYAGELPEEKSPAERADFLNRRAAAYQAYYEHMPLRASSVPNGPDMQLYRTIRHGRLIDFHVLDTRQFRTDQPAPGPMEAQLLEAKNPSATILGSEQRQWLFKELESGRPTWNVLAQQVMMAYVDRKPGEGTVISMDKWTGYEMERRAVLKKFLEMKDSTPVVLTGDIHSHWANNLESDPENPESPIAAAEFITSSISSKGDGKHDPKTSEGLRRENPGVNYFSDRRGYVTCHIDAKTWRSDFQTVEYVSRKGAPLDTEASFVVEKGQRGMQKA
jgi:alkaline phosphatase D